MIISQFLDENWPVIILVTIAILIVWVVTWKLTKDDDKDTYKGEHNDRL